MATYSAFFSSGLLAPYDRNGSITPTPTPSTSTSFPTIASSSSMHLSPPMSTTTSSITPRVRRRRSSFNIGASPMALIKSPARNAGSALLRTGVASPTRNVNNIMTGANANRNRAGSVNEAMEDNSLFGRLGMGSAGTQLQFGTRPRRTLRKAHGRARNPTAPPPTAPLPALPPPSPSPKCSQGSFAHGAKYTGHGLAPPPTIIVPAPRRPLGQRALDNVDMGSVTDSMLLSPVYVGNPTTPTKRGSGYEQSQGYSPLGRALASSPAIPEHIEGMGMDED
ncbi:hypothetical protein BJ138DRAFT_1154092 [Hygrophoropsis aurantiaca]|uniref:Uncharacterized protein n=1 Tax=Hygrophoropsis aurantiaca TaxID=72124 RepID=A0ACB8AA26_9AGAM|nr:hypothetical protein BJ138DRAFT_1154092 [Hygrophoropsis aurantiaca]